MSIRLVLGIALAALLSTAGAFVVTADSIGELRGGAPVVFVCRNGVAMSVWSAAYFNRLAEARGLRERAVSRAAIPSFEDVPANMVLALGLDGFVLGGYRPAVVSADDVRGAELVVAIDTELPSGPAAAVGKAEKWEGFPPMREQYFPSRRELKARVEALVEQIAAAEAAAETSEAASLVR
jgi:hypothetical protein